MTESRERLRADLQGLGFDDVRFADLADFDASGLGRWISNGFHADMAWMERTAEKRADPQKVLPGAQSVILLGVNYWTDRPAPAAGPRWARYSLFQDYHDTIKPALVEAGRVLERSLGLQPDDYKYYVDTGPVLERGWGARSGLGFIGKNAMLISRRHGNWLFLASILVRAPFPPDEPVRPKPPSGTEIGLLCGKCTRCLDACPTDAFPQPGVVDARRCISYQTIENKGIIPRELRSAIGQRIYGCDTCLDVCPWNRFAHEGRRMLLSARADVGDVPLAELLALTPERFAAIFKGTPIKRIKLGGVLRNACIVAGNSGETGYVPALRLLVAHPLAMVRAHAIWALRKLGAEAQLPDVALEQDPAVREEYALPLY